MEQREDVAFKTLDGLTLRGHFYPARGGGKNAAIIMTPGFGAAKDIFLPNIASAFQAAGISALVYDPRTSGASDGEPRNDIDPARQVGDYHDALTYLRSAESQRVDPARIGYWGFSFAGAVALNAAALDRRARLVVAVCPLTQNWDLGARREKVLAKAIRDREAQVGGGAAPFRLPLVDERTGENPAGFDAGGTGPDEAKLVADVAARVPGFDGTTTLQTYYHVAAWDPFPLVPFVSPTPVLVVTPEADAISPAEKQRALYYDVMQYPKEQFVVPGAGHMNCLSGHSFGPTVAAQIDFIHRYLGTGSN